LTGAGGIGHCFEIRDPAVKGKIADLPVGHAASALIVADEAKVR
jgi:hypothetical protein